jgi:hypothetical protein
MVCKKNFLTHKYMHASLWICRMFIFWGVHIQDFGTLVKYCMYMQVLRNNTENTKTSKQWNTMQKKILVLEDDTNFLRVVSSIFVF